MTITVEIRPEVQAELARQAAAHGSPIEDYAARLLENAAQVAGGETTPPASAYESMNLFDLFAPIRGLLTDQEIDRCFGRNPSLSRPVDLG